jgi:hypothetical protein
MAASSTSSTLSRDGRLGDRHAREGCAGVVVAAKIARMGTYELVYPTGEAVQREGDVPPVGYDVDGFRVD